MQTSQKGIGAMITRKLTMFQVLALVVAAGALLLTAAGRASADTTKSAAEPISHAILGQGMPSGAPGQVLLLERYELAPGATIPTHTHPGAYVIYVESGDFGFTVVKGAAQITRAGSTSPEAIQAGPEVVGHQGDVFFENSGVVHSARNTGTTPAVVLTAALLAADQPALQPSNDEGTPAS